MIKIIKLLRIILQAKTGKIFLLSWLSFLWQKPLTIRLFGLNLSFDYIKYRKFLSLKSTFVPSFIESNAKK